MQKQPDDTWQEWHKKYSQAMEQVVLERIRNEERPKKQLEVPRGYTVDQRFEVLRAQIVEEMDRKFERLQQHIDFRLANMVDAHMGDVQEMVRDLVAEWNEFQEDNS